ncbi:MAG: hypothetical protein KDA58_13905 [Planctomycetaceae bacterium]|nr:hypothetical protein [Planctomycetaceae bacterium]
MDPASAELQATIELGIFTRFSAGDIVFPDSLTRDGSNIDLGATGFASALPNVTQAGVTPLAEPVAPDKVEVFLTQPTKTAIPCDKHPFLEERRAL